MSTYINPAKPRALQYDDCPVLLRLFIEYERGILNKSPRTVNSHYIDMRVFLRFLKRVRGLVPEDMPIDEISIADVSRELIAGVEKRDIVRFLYYLTDERQNSPESQQHKLITLRTFYKYMCREQGLPVNPAAEIPGAKVQKYKNKKPIYLSLEESNELLDAAGGRYEERNYCIITFLLNLGLRVSELVAIDSDDISEGALLVHGKGNKERTVYLNDACGKALQDYMQVREEWVKQELVSEDEYALFVSLHNHGRRITTRSVQKMLHKTVLEAGLDPRYTPHKLRHTAATLMYQYGSADLMTLQQILGHESPETSEIYVHIDEKRMINATRNAPLARAVRNKKKNPSST